MKGQHCAFSHDGGDTIPVPDVSSNVQTQENPVIGSEENTPLLFIPRQHSSEATTTKLEQLDHPTEDPATEPPLLPSTDRSMYNCSVNFGAGAAVLRVITPFESRRILISNIPASVSDGDISAAIFRLTTPADVQMHRPPLSALAAATLMFDDANAAAQAVSLISEISIGGKVLCGQLDLHPHAAAEEGKGVLRSRKIKLTWYGRRESAFVHYSTARSAEEHSKRLNGALYRGYTLSASFRPTAPAPTTRYRIRPSTQLFTVMLRNLPLDTSKIHLTGFCQAQSVALDPPRCPEDSAIQMQRALERFGSVDTFDVWPTTKATAKITAFAQFQNPSAAGAAESALGTSPPVFLGRIPFFIERTFSVKYNIRGNLFAKIKGAVDLLAGLHPTMIRYYLGENFKEPVVLVVHGSEPKELGRMKTELDRIVQGELLVVDGQKFWDDFFERAEGETFLESLNAGENMFVRCDSRTRTLRVFGPEMDRVQARNLIIDKLVEIGAHRHVFPLRKDLIRVLLRGRLRELQDSLGVDCLTIDVVGRTLTVHGDANYVRRVQAELSALESGNILGSVKVEASAENTCPVCFCDVEDPVKLDCGHVYCRECLQHYLRPASQDTGFSPRECLAEVTPSAGGDPRSAAPCRLGIACSIIRSLLTSAEEDCLLRASFLAHINEHPTDFRYCPSPDCEMVYRPSGMGSSFQCPSCLVQVCPACNVGHEGMSCAEHQDNLTGGLAALAKWREKNGVKQCPNCHADIEKNGGCNHMTCFFCKTHICWICMKTFSDRGSNGGVYPHMQREHGGHTTYDD
ncbi:hypothetical protein B0H17DRAFT_1216309 [Mycena rosella]|uniref:RBR-type E3 ubiquitin transferase n=1 Tax=Mycena rosella TaxID=1033263 RepID=A0AAD7FXK1_MYCRO|nr:hypothetical protein B0H17DRAFT_1216309 [Mycena rosella]